MVVIIIMLLFSEMLCGIGVFLVGMNCGSILFDTLRDKMDFLISATTAGFLILPSEQQKQSNALGLNDTKKISQLCNII